MKNRKKWIAVLLLAFSLFLTLTTVTFANEKYVELAKKNCVECHTDKYYIANDFFFAETVSKWYFQMWALSIASFIFLVGLIWRIYIWSMGEGNPLTEVKEVEKKRLFDFFIFEVFFQRKIFKTDKVRWFVFVSESLGFIVLFAIFLLMAFTKFMLKLDLVVNGAGGLIFDFLLDSVGLLMLVGTIVSFARRIKKRDDMITERKDMAAIILLFVIVATGFLLEAFKFAILPVTFESYFSYVGFGISSIIRHVELPWVDMRYYLWIIHAIFVFVFIAYIPFSKLMHMIACPITVVTSSKDPQG